MPRWTAPIFSPPPFHLAMRHPYNSPSIHYMNASMPHNCLVPSNRVTLPGHAGIGPSIIDTGVQQITNAHVSTSVKTDDYAIGSTAPAVNMLVKNSITNSIAKQSVKPMDSSTQSGEVVRRKDNMEQKNTYVDVAER